jgi:hypothetical protein
MAAIHHELAGLPVPEGDLVTVSLKVNAPLSSGTVSYLDRRAGRPRAEIAAAFHETIANAAAEPRTAVLSGGTFQNLRLPESTRRASRRSAFERRRDQLRASRGCS